jgi:hypothetical protein
MSFLTADLRFIIWFEFLSCLGPINRNLRSRNNSREGRKHTVQVYSTKFCVSIADELCSTLHYSIEKELMSSQLKSLFISLHIFIKNN